VHYIPADVLDKAVEVPESAECAGTGAAVLAGTACGVFSDAAEASAKVSLGRTFEPDARRARLQKERYARYLETQARLMSGG